MSDSVSTFRFVPESLRRVIARVEHVRMSVADLEAARAFDDTGEIVLASFPASEHEDTTAAVERLTARGVPVFPLRRSA